MNDRFKWEFLIGAALFTSVGLFAGWKLADPVAESHEAEESTHSPVVLSDVTIRNLGVTFGEAQLTTYTHTITVAAVIEAPPRSELSVFAPIGGRVLSVNVRRGQYAAPGSSVVTLVRDPLPRPELTLTSNILKPAQEQLHQTVVELRRSASELHIVRTELKRIEQFTDTVDGQVLPVIPLQRSIDLKYQRTRAEAVQDQAKLELLKHGFSEEQVDAVGAGGSLPPLDQGSWKLALTRNGLWTEGADQLHAALPASIGSLPWVTATVGELAAMGLASPELTAWVSSVPGAAQHFLDIGVLLQRGHTLADLQRLYGLGAFEPIVIVEAPPTGTGGGWDVGEIWVKPGALVQAGAPLVAISNPETLYLRAEPVGSEVAALLKAATEGNRMQAVPLVAGSGPELADLRVSFIASSDSSLGTEVYIEAQNDLLNTEGEARTWSLRKGLRYQLLVPQETLSNVYVLPSGAVTTMGPDTVVFLRDGESFKPVSVAIAYRDEKVVVLDSGPGMEIFPGDLIALSGAFELGFALQAGGAETDAHAGHSH